MKKLLLLKATARLSLSIASAFLGLIVISSVVSHEGWRHETGAHSEWVSRGHAQLCTQVRSGNLSPREALAKILSGRTWQQADLPFDGQNPHCDAASIEKLSRGNEYTRLFVEHQCQLLARQEGEKWLALARARCLDPKRDFDARGDAYLFLYYSPRDPRVFPRYVWEEQISGDMPEILLAPFALTLGIFLLLSIGRLCLTEAHLGWRRVSLVIGASASLVAPLGILLSADGVGDDEIGFALAAALAAFPLAILLVLGGKRLAGWVAVGFRPGAASGSRPVGGLTEMGVRAGSPARASLYGVTTTNLTGALRGGELAAAPAPEKSIRRPGVAECLALVLVAAWAVSLPSAIASAGSIHAPLWYVALAVMAEALGASLWALVIGAIVLAANRSRPDGGLKASVITALIVGAIITGFVLRAELFS